MPSRLGHCKLCDRNDFTDPELVSFIREIFPGEQDRFGAAFPTGFEYRKYWEVAMAARAFAKVGVLHDRAEVLGVGAGTEATSFWLTNAVRRVFATDLYLDPGDWQRDAPASMLLDAQQYARCRWNRRRLVVQHMNALELAYEDESFDGIYSSSSIEHFGNWDDVRRSADEMFRVLKKGGLLSISTEYRLAGPPPGLPGTLLFDEADLRKHVVAGLDWELLSPLDVELSPQTRESEIDFAEAVSDARAGRAAWSTYPHIVLRADEHVWTSVHLALVKSGEPTELP